MTSINEINFSLKSLKLSLLVASTFTHWVEFTQTNENG